jgi:NitT/TauT family transport system substrate-binding protein
MKASWRYRLSSFLLLTIFTWVLTACGSSSTPTTTTASGNASATPITVNLGYFPNLTHSAALVGLANGTYAKDIAPNTLNTTTFNAGGDLTKALLAGSIDIGFVGPSPTVNAYVKSNALKVISGASSGGVLFVVQPDENITKPSDLSGKKIADPQLGATQDVSLRHYLQQHGLNATDKGGTVQIVPTDNSTIVTLFKQKQIDGAWVPEPYASRLVIEGKGKVFLDERSLWPGGKFVTTNVIVRTAFLNQHPDVVKKFLQGEVDTIQYINSNLSSTKALANQQLASIPGGKKLAQATLDSAFKDLTITYDPLAQSFISAANNSYALGYLTKKPDFTGIYDLDPLNAVLTSKGLTKVTAS